MKTEEKIIVKIQKLLALAGNNPNEHERKEAMIRAQELLAEHDLDIAQVENFKEKIVVGLMLTDIASTQWKGVLLKAACDLYDCKVLTSGRKLVILGQKTHASVALEIMRWLMAIIEKEARTQIKRRNEAYKETVARFGKSVANAAVGSVKSKQLKQSFCLGAAYAVWENARAIVKQRNEAAHGPGKANMLAIIDRNKKAIEEFLEKAKPGQASNSRPDIDSSAMRAGARYGETIGLERQLNTSPEAKRIGMK